MKLLLLLVSFSAFAGQKIVVLDGVTLPSVGGNVRFEGVANDVVDAMDQGIAIGWAQCAVCVDDPKSKGCIRDRNDAVKTLKRILK